MLEFLLASMIAVTPAEDAPPKPIQAIGDAVKEVDDDPIPLPPGWVVVFDPTLGIEVWLDPSVIDPATGDPNVVDPQPGDPVIVLLPDDNFVDWPYYDFSTGELVGADGQVYFYMSAPGGMAPVESPEPGTLALLSVGAAFGIWQRRKTRAAG